ncbi:Lrp/AsnC ligand binding domain-containing protein [Meiothermus ruber]|jgi:DNA-binding Lrp family transcriptional regulator|uniref:AsnC family transcriptional regulator n=1 Tax=Meiothermus ruber (strain ATCC 35948 / DSM 1279 / VKM B-1258 / 21) TaxID=504728 RepID=D3PS36_MEIRD|nr:Lrp/AsnC ligand binding domain-containing protein [Meiothermus ruber]ADD28269.1 transcriptional regulator, AsnC family [Meiothermus ruber DSM 1279]AGK06291.1 AsnC family transcriptional regulator [Meiothermus ruber DSM 1279]MCL6529649.1 Lrp/AsnC ligand binding domain-containing protein [Meiothermus ruber]MCX7802257.1 Lrp/AsnC ligand binding domain-containing protein [Meiothermus ruber]GAO75213.1 AsnC family transcriptional regulator [Meiothermus ruber H328]
MITAFVLIQTSRESTAETAEAVAEIPGVAEVYSVTGEWDLVAILRFKDFEQLDDIVTLGLRKLRGIERTQTLLAFRAYSRKLLEQGFNIGGEGL